MRLSSAGFSPQSREGEKKVLNSELWHACAGPLVSLPAIGNRVVYFPQGHSEQLESIDCFKSHLLLQEGCCLNKQRSGGSYPKLPELTASTYLPTSKGKRFCMPNAKVRIHQPLGTAGGKATEMGIRITEMNYSKIELNKILSRVTGKPEEQVEIDMDRDNFMNAWEAKEYHQNGLRRM